MLRTAIARLALAAGRFTLVGDKPTDPHAVILAVPHTSNWDLLYTLAAARLSGLTVHWMGKRSLFWSVQGVVLRRLGGIAVDRDAPGGQVAALVAEMGRKPSLHLVIPPEGTRSYRDHWRSGFYHIARGAGVPIVPAFLDYSTRQVGFGPSFLASGDVGADMDRLRAFYAGMTGRIPGRASRIRLREEDVVAAAARAGSV